MKGLSHTDDKMPKWLEDFLGRSQLVLVFNREPGCTYTAGHSRRNISLSTLKPTISMLVDNGYKVIRYGGSHMERASEYGVQLDGFLDYATSTYVPRK